MSSILNLILYNPSESYDGMKDVLRVYMKKANPTIRYYFYSYKADLESACEICGDEMFFQGVETFLPGILEKTVAAIELSLRLFKFDYIVRTNISTICNFEKLAHFLSRGGRPIQYGGSTMLVLQWPDPCSGITDNRLFGLKFISGTGIILSREQCQKLVDLKHEIDYSVIDDVAIGDFYSKHHHTEPPYPLDRDGEFPFVYNINEEALTSIQNVIFYRNRSNDRNADVATMRRIVDHISPPQSTPRKRCGMIFV